MTEILAVEVPLCRDRGGLLGGPTYECELPEGHGGPVHKGGPLTWDRTRHHHFAPMFRGMHRTDELPRIEPEPVADKKPWVEDDQPPPPAPRHGLLMAMGAALIVALVAFVLAVWVLWEILHMRGCVG